MNPNMLKNNKILKAQMGISLPASVPGWTMNNLIEWLTAGGLEAASSARTAASTVASGTSSVPTSMANLSTIPVGLAAFAMTRPHAASGAVQIAHQNQLAKEKEGAIKKEQKYWDNKADYYSNALSSGAMMTPTGEIITGYNPSTRTLSGYRDIRNGDRIFVDKNLQTGVYSNPVYKDAKTGAYYEGTINLNGDTALIGRGENLMPYSIIPVEKPKWMVSNPSDVLKLTVPIVFKKNKPESKQTSSEASEKATVNPKSPNEEDKENNNSDKDNNNSNKDYNEKGYKQSPVEEWMNEFPEKVNAYRRWRIGNSKDVWHNKSGNISWDGTKLLNRGVTPTNTGQSPSLWGTRLKWGIGGATGGAIGYGIYSSWNNKSNDSQRPELDGTIKTVNDAIEATNASNNFSNTSNNVNYNINSDINAYQY